MNEPDGARLAAVQGCSALSWDFVYPNLPPPAARHSFTLHWPKWVGDHWVVRYALGDVDDAGTPCVVLQLWPGGACTLRLYRDEAPFVEAATSHLPVDPADPVRSLFTAVADVFGARLIGHMRKACAKA